MPARPDIQREILSGKQQAQDRVRRRYLGNVHRHTKRDTILYASGWHSAAKYPGLNQQHYSLSSQDLQGFMAALHGLQGDALDLILHSPGGSGETVDQIVQYLRSKYPGNIRAVIPQNAMSAATMLACACDEIVMGKHSAIGPIDPQITFPTQHGLFAAPAQCLLDDFERAKKEVAGNPVLAALWATKIKDYPPGILQICDNTIKLSKQKVAEWLQTYMFRGDNSAGKKATDIAEWLGTANHHLTHGRPIGIEAAHKVGLKVTPLENDQVLQERVLSVFHATAVTFEVSNVVKIIENQRGKGFYVSIAEGKSGS